MPGVMKDATTKPEGGIVAQGPLRPDQPPESDGEMSASKLALKFP